MILHNPLASAPELLIHEYGAIPIRTALLILTTLHAAAATSAETINVPGDHATIQSAINASIDGDVIEIAAGTYNEFDLSTQQKAITVRGATDAQGLPATTIDSQGQGTTVMSFNGEGTDTIIEHLVFTGASETSWAAVTMFHARPTVNNCTFRDNVTGGIGGGVYNLNGAPSFTDCRFINNTANWGGGYACWETGQPDHPLFDRCTFSGNTAALGGGFANLRSSPVLVECIFTDNIATEDGGAFFNEGDDCCERWFGDVVMQSCEFNGNTAVGAGGAIRNRTFGTTTLDGCTISGNAAGLEGSAIASSTDTTAVLSNTTVCANSGTTDQIDGPTDLDGTNVITDACPADCEGDVTGDGDVNVTDLLAVIGSWGDPYDVSDLLAVIGGWGECP
ncbi:MAG: right-handed parallel beta-helix repeat-containing protein [Phycisphaerales bacterium]|nr:right-handed parallel beta-helix repeat-containing protein [Phycisphaerales bacterium]